METAVVVIDMQCGYFENGELVGRQDELVAANNDLLRLAHERGAPVYVVVTEHARNGSTWTLSMLDDGQGYMFAGSEQAALLPGLKVGDAHTVTKIRDSAFHGTDLAQRLRLHGIKRLVLAGVSGQNCVARTGADAFALDFRVAYARDAIGSTDPRRGREALDLLGEEQRQPQLGMAELQDWIR